MQHLKVYYYYFFFLQIVNRIMEEHCAANLPAIF